MLKYFIVKQHRPLYLDFPYKDFLFQNTKTKQGVNNVSTRHFLYSSSLTEKALCRFTTGDEQSDNLRKTENQGLMYQRDVVWAFRSNPHLYWATIGRLSQLATSFKRPFVDWSESCHSIVIALAATTQLRHNLKCCFCGQSSPVMCRNSGNSIIGHLILTNYYLNERLKVMFEH